MAQWYRICLLMQEMQVWSLGQEDLPEEEMVTHFSVFLPGKSHGQRSLEGYIPWGHKELDTTEHTHTQRKNNPTSILSP